MIDCYNCKAKTKCIAAAEPGSVICAVNRLNYGGTHADDAPTVDAVEVVRCKDCTYYEYPNTCHCHKADENGTPIFVRDDDFCSYGERKEK